MMGSAMGRAVARISPIEEEVKKEERSRLTGKVSATANHKALASTGPATISSSTTTTTIRRHLRADSDSDTAIVGPTAARAVTQ